MPLGPTVVDLFELLRASPDEAEAKIGSPQLLLPLEPWTFRDLPPPQIELVTVGARSQLLRTTAGRQEPAIGAPCLPLLAGRPKLLGRAGTLELVVDQPTVSRLHAEILDDREQFAIRDRGSHNGTRVNEIVLGPDDVRPLRDGDVIVLGDAQLLYASLGHLSVLLGLSR